MRIFALALVLSACALVGPASARAGIVDIFAFRPDPIAAPTTWHVQYRSDIPLLQLGFRFQGSAGSAITFFPVGNIDVSEAFFFDAPPHLFVGMTPPPMPGQLIQATGSTFLTFLELTGPLEAIAGDPTCDFISGGTPSGPGGCTAIFDENLVELSVFDVSYVVPEPGAATLLLLALLAGRSRALI